MRRRRDSRHAQMHQHRLSEEVSDLQRAPALAVVSAPLFRPGGAGAGGGVHADTGSSTADAEADVGCRPGRGVRAQGSCRGRNDEPHSRLGGNPGRRVAPGPRARRAEGMMSGACAVCGYRSTLRTDGKVRLHARGGDLAQGYCRGSGRPPAQPRRTTPRPVVGHRCGGPGLLGLPSCGEATKWRRCRTCRAVRLWALGRPLTLLQQEMVRSRGYTPTLEAARALRARQSEEAA